MNWLNVDIGTLQAAYASAEIAPSQVVSLFINTVVAPEYAPV